MKKFNTDRLYFVSGLLIGIMFVLIYFSRLYNHHIDYYLGSDILYFPALFKDIFIEGNSLKGWSIPGAPGFFPDMFLYFILMSITGKITLSAMLFALIQFTTIILLVSYIYKLCKPEVSYRTLMLVPLCLTLFLMPAIFSNDFLISFHLLSNTYHVGPFVNTLISTLLLLKFLQRQNLKYLVALLTIVFVAIISDKLFLVMFSIPIIFTLLITLKRENLLKQLKIAVSIIITSGISLFAFRMLRFSGWFHIRAYSSSTVDFQKIIHSGKVFSQQIGNYTTNNFFASILFILSFICLFLLIFTIIRNFRRIRNENEINYGLLLFCFALFNITIVMFVPILLGDYGGQAKIRYNISSFFMSILILPFLLDYLIGQKIKSRIILKTFPFALLSLFAILMIKSLIPGNFVGGLSKYANFYSEQAQAIDFANSKTKLKQGVATYWNAKPADLFNKSDIRVHTCLPSAYADYYIVGNEQWYSQSESDSNKIFNFVLLNTKEDSSLVIKSLGKPVDVISYQSYNVLIFNDFTYKGTRAPFFLQHK